MATRRFRVLTAGVMLLAVVLVVTRTSGYSDPGRSLSWAGVPVSAQPAAPPVEASPVPTAAAPTTPADGGVLGALRAPLSGLFHQLNSETKHSAAGQYSILQDITSALRDRITEFLDWVVGRH